MHGSAESDKTIGQVIESFASRLQNGELPSVAEYKARYPHLADEIEDVLPALEILERAESHPAVSRSKLALDDSIPEVLGQYKLIQEIGRGGMGIVFEAKHATMQRHVALKVLPKSSAKKPIHLSRFLREARAAGQLHHSNIVPVFEIGQSADLHFYAMQFIRGQNLDLVINEIRRIRDRSKPTTQPTHVQGTMGSSAQAKSALSNSIALTMLSAEPILNTDRPSASCAVDAQASAKGRTDVLDQHASQGELNATTSLSDSVFAASGSSATGRVRNTYFHRVATVGIQVADALEYAHQHHVLHRDIKPANLILDTEGVVWVTDFGLAKPDEDDLTHTGDIVGTLRYMAPEQFSGTSGPQSDVYSLGLTLYELATLRYAFDEVDRAALVRQASARSTRAPRDIDASIPRDLETIILTAIESKPERRYKSARHLADDLQAFLADVPIKARRVTLVERCWRVCRRNPVLTSMAMCIASLLTVVAIGSLWFAGHTARQASDLRVANRRSQRSLEKARQATIEREAAAARAEATSQSLVEMILTGSPYKSGSYTVHQMLIDYESKLADSLGEYPEMEARLRRAIGFVLVSRNELKAARSNFQHALRLIERAGQERSLLAATTRELLAHVYQRERNRSEACRQLETVIDLKTQLLGADHRETLQSRVRWLGALREVSPKVLTDEKIHGELDKVAAAVAGRLADREYAEIFLQARSYAVTLANRLGRYELSARYCRERLSLLREMYPNQANHPAIVYALQHSAEIKRLQGDFEGALAGISDAMLRTRQWFGDKVTPEAIDLIVDEAKTHQAAGDFSSMETSARRAFELGQRHLEQGHPFTLDGARFLAEALQGLGRNEEAGKIRQEFDIR